MRGCRGKGLRECDTLQCTTTAGSGGVMDGIWSVRSKRFTEDSYGTLSTFDV